MSIRVGAFGNDNSVASDEAVIYIDRAGSTHLELNEGQREEVKEIVPKGHRKGTVLATSPLALMDIPPPDEATKKSHSREVATLQQKPIVAHWGRSECGKQAVSKNRATSKVAFIHQPKKGF